MNKRDPRHRIGRYRRFSCSSFGIVAMISVKLSNGLSRPAERGSSELIGRPTNQGLLSHLPEHLFRSLFSRATTVRLKTDEVLFLAGDPGDGCYRVLDGLLKVVMTSDGNERILALLGLGAIAGELSVIDRLPRSASVVAVRPQF
jgi:CRP-like cAMP-binding protein